MHNYLRIFVFVAISFTVYTPLFSEEPKVVDEINVTTLLIKQDFYEGRMVKVAGFAVFTDKRDSFLYDSADAAEHDVTACSIAVAIDSRAWTQIKEIKKGWVQIYGIFHSLPKQGVDTIGRPFVKIDGILSITPLTTLAQEDRAKIIQGIARIETMLEILENGGKLPLSRAELEKELKEAYLGLRYFDLTGKKHYQGELGDPAKAFAPDSKVK